MYKIPCKRFVLLVTGLLHHVLQFLDIIIVLCKLKELVTSLKAKCMV